MPDEYDVVIVGSGAQTRPAATACSPVTGGARARLGGDSMVGRGGVRAWVVPAWLATGGT